MKAIIINKPGEAVLASVVEPRPDRERLLLMVQMIGLCGSNLNSFRGKKPDGDFPADPGA